MAQGTRKFPLKLTLLAAVAGLTSLGSAVSADTFTWNGSATPDNSWNNAANWTPSAAAGVPGSADTANFSGGTTPSPSTVDLTQDQAVATMNNNDKVVQFNLNNFSLGIGVGAANSTATMTADGENGNTIFNGPGTVNVGGNFRIGESVASLQSLWTNVTAQGGAQVNTAQMEISDYRTGGILNVKGPGTVWNSNGPVTFARGGKDLSGGGSYSLPRAQLLITDGAVFNHNLGNNGTNLFTIGRGSLKDSYIKVDGAGSQLNFTGTYASNLIIGGYQSAVTFDIVNGGVLSNVNDMGLSFRNEGTTPKVNTFNINGANSRMSAKTITLAGRSTSDVGRGATVVNVGTGGLLEATDSDGSDRSIVVGDRGLLSLQGGSVSAPSTKNIIVAQGSVAGTKSTLEGFGTITSGNLIAQQDSIVRPGINGAGTIHITEGNLTTTAGTTPTELDFQLQTTSANPHDMIGLHSATSTATIGDNATSAITFATLDGGTLAPGAEGFMDFLIGGTVNYGGATLLGNIPDIDNLDDLLAAAGYTRVDAAVAPGAGEYRYYLASVGANDYAGDFVGEQAVRLEFAAPAAGVPEPASLGILALGGLVLLRRRRCSGTN